MYFSTKGKTSILLAAIIVAAGTLIQVSAYTGGEISIKLNNTQFTRLKHDNKEWIVPTLPDTIVFHFLNPLGQRH
ncbi:MAG: hypothetical protein ACHQ1D_11975 [Nitrososphaerales archaeon]